MAYVPRVVVLLCGKRKSGKDFVACKLQEMLGGEVLSVLRLSKPLKEQYAKDHGLDLEKLMDSSEYKELHRKEMIKWGEDIRTEDSTHFCRLAAIVVADKPVWLVCDTRRPTDMEYFKSEYGDRCVCVRVVAGDSVRVRRGWVFVPGVDDAPSECGLDDYHCDITIENNDENKLKRDLEILQEVVKSKLETHN